MQFSKTARKSWGRRISIFPNLLAEGMHDALAASRAKKVFVCNLLTKWGETHDCVASDIAKAVLSYSGLKRFDHAICNTAEMDEKLVAAYKKEKKYPIVCDDVLSDYAANVITGDFFSEADIARHDSAKISKII